MQPLRVVLGDLGTIFPHPHVKYSGQKKSSDCVRKLRAADANL